MELPIVDEPDVLVVLPFVRLRDDAFLEQGDGQIGTAGAARVRLGEENRAKPVGDAESRIERRRTIEERIEQMIFLRPSRQMVAAEMLHGANPVEIGRHRGVREREARHHRTRLQVEERIEAFGRVRIAAIVHDLNADSQGEQRRRGDDRAADGRRVASVRHGRHLKSRRAKIVTVATINAPMYTAAYASVSSTCPLATGCPCTTAALTSNGARFGRR